MFDWTTASTLVFGCVLFLVIRRRILANRRSHPFPPGPPGLPWAGNVIGIDTSAPWRTYAHWSKTYGDIIYTKLMGKDTIIINSEKITRDLFEKRSKNYSDRPHLFINEIYAQDFSSVQMHYGDRWRMHRRFFHQTFRLEAVSRFQDLQHRKSCRLLQQLFDTRTPEQLNEHVFEFTASISLNTTYDYDPASRDDEMVVAAANLLDVLMRVQRPDAAIIVGAFPFLFSLPTWLPGISLRKEAEMVRAASKEYIERPFEYSLLKAKTPGNTIAASMVYDGLQTEEEGNSTWMIALKDASATAFMAASETSNSVLLSFFLLMMLNPDVQEKAQAQVDAVVDKDRLPTIDDRPLLPFVDAIFREILRYNPVIPLHPHATVDDDVYEGFHIPKGAIVLANAWSMAHNESRYPNPHAFIPQRFLDEDGSLKPNDVEQIAFGFGRRVCPGRHLADTSIFVVMARVLAVFKIMKPLDGNGVEMTIEPKFSAGLAVHPLPFQCRFVPRDSEMDARKLADLIAVSTA